MKFLCRNQENRIFKAGLFILVLNMHLLGEVVAI